MTMQIPNHVTQRAADKAGLPTFHEIPFSTLNATQGQSSLISFSFTFANNSNRCCPCPVKKYTTQYPLTDKR